jgi:hypothetical protein
MSKRKRKLTPGQRRARRKRKPETMIVFINGKQKRVPRYAEPMIEGLPVDEFVRRIADGIWYLQDEDYAALYEWEQRQSDFYRGTPGEPPAQEANEEWICDEQWMLGEEYRDDLYTQVVRQRKVDFCPDTERPPTPEFPEVLDEDDGTLPGCEFQLPETNGE